MIDPSATRTARFGQLAAFLVFLVILLAPSSDALPPAAQRAAAVAVAMGTLWFTQAVPLGATSLIPLVAFPLLGIQSAREVSSSYINESVFLYLGGFIVALGIERWGLHRRIALHVVRAVGVGPKRIVLGFSLATAFLSMWMSNTAATMLMIPIALALLGSFDELSTTSDGEQPPAPSDKERHALSVAVLLGVAYSASIGGLATLVGTPTNIVFRQIYSATFPDAPEISAGQWMTSFVPLGVAFLLVMWLALTFRLKPIPGAERLERSFFTERLRALGPPTKAEWRMLVVFAATALLWLFRTPFSFSGDPDAAALIPGWGPALERLMVWFGIPEDTTSGLVTDSTVAMTMAALLFFLPSGTAPERPDDLVVRSPRSARANLMDWPTANRLPWEVLLLFGGGFALADAFQQTGLSQWVGEEFALSLGGQATWLVIIATCLLLTVLSEFASNTATASIILPILAPAAVQMGMDPRLVMVAATLAASCGFMLPAATPPNALVFTSGRVSAIEMAKRGFVLDIIGVVLVTLAALWLFAPIMGIDPHVVPSWAME